MSAVVYSSNGGLENLKCGLKQLSKSQLMAVPEFEYMYRVIEKHHRDAKNKAVKDTKFYNILVQMLCEIQKSHTEDQRESLRLVYTWYMTNKHALFCGPQFGKEHMKDEAKKSVLKARIPIHLVHIKSAADQPLQPKIDSVSAGRFRLVHGPDSPQEEPTSPANPPRELTSPANPPRELTSPANPPRELTSPENSLKEHTSCISSPRELLSSMSSPGELTPSTSSPRELASSTSSQRELKFPEDISSELASFDDPRKESSSLPEFVRTIRNAVHPIASLINPHTNTMMLQSTMAANQLDEKVFIPMRATSAKPSRSDSLQAWQMFNKKRSYGQDVISKLNLVGRSGTAADIRYSAHDFGENPEAYTQDFLKHHTQQSRLSTHQDDEGNIFTQQTLQEFWEAAENIRPIGRDTFRNYTFRRAKSTPSGDQNGCHTGNRTHFTHKRAKSTLSEHYLGNWYGQEDNISQENCIGVNLDSVIGVIDSVTNHMTYYKEKLAPEPQQGYWQPSAAGMPIQREVSSAFKNDLIVDSKCPTDGRDEITFTVKDDTPDLHNKAKIRCVSAGTVDWRGRIQPEAISYKDLAVKELIKFSLKCAQQMVKKIFGDHTYLKTGHRPGLRSAGSTSAGGRPKTAPMTFKKKWKTKRPSDKNIRAIQAASHNTTVVDDDDVETMMQVQHLLNSQDRSDSVDFEINFHDAPWKVHRKNTKEQPVLEYLSFIAPSRTKSSETKSQKSVHVPGKKDERNSTSRDSSPENVDQSLKEDLSIAVSDSYYDEGALNAALRDDFKSLIRDESLNSHTSVKCDREHKRQEHFQDIQLNSTQFVQDCSPNAMTTRVQRSAGRIPGHSHSTSVQMKIFNQHRIDALRKVPPLRTSVSIPSSHIKSMKSQTNSGQILLELERHARKTQNPIDCMKRVEGLRSVDTAANNQSSLTTDIRHDSAITRSLQICQLRVPGREQSSQWKYPCRPTRSEITVSAGHDVVFNQSEDLILHRNTTLTSTGTKKTGGRSGITDVKTTPIVKPFNKIGRPIAQVVQTPDPDAVLQAVQIKKEAAAVVDIQRIFRGYVARNVYKSLLSEERWKKEEARKAAVRIQRMYRRHLTRKHDIYNRPNLDPEIVQWSKDLQEIQSENATKRQAKLASLSNELRSNHREVISKLAVIGPHVEVYSAYHPKKTGPSKQEHNQAAVKIQKIVRGWLLRRRLKKLSKKAIWNGSNFYKLAKEYKSMLRRVQVQHGVDKPKTPFTVQDFNEYIDLRKKYGTVFEKRSFGAELELGTLEAFFKECDLYPSRAEIDEAMDVTMHGNASRRNNQGLTKTELMDLIFYIYVPPSAGIHGSRRSTWMNPIIDGKEARKLLGSEFVEAAPLAPCIKLVLEAKREQRQREQAEKDADERCRIEKAEKRIEENKHAVRKLKKVTLLVPEAQD